MAETETRKKFPYPTNPKRILFTRWLCKVAADIGFGVLWRLRRFDLDNLPMHGPTILVFNHTTFFDTITVMESLWRRQIVPIGKVELLDNPFTALLMWCWHPVLINREGLDRNAIRQSLEVLESDEALLLAPEGHRNPTGLQNPQPGAVLLAKRTNAVIVPVGVSGTENFWKSLKSFRRTPVVIRVGKPLKLRASLDRTQYQAAIDEITYKLSELVEPNLRGDFADLSKSTMNLIEYA